ncbi:MAG: hypothetical protein J3K34DRAFT_521144 [Monoraphidium minutum]|nr:MAG: hypothetical protein J3K34DRAFT_521144 [Monoraphidium minutum]
MACGLGRARALRGQAIRAPNGAGASAPRARFLCVRAATLQMAERAAAGARGVVAPVPWPKQEATHLAQLGPHAPAHQQHPGPQQHTGRQPRPAAPTGAGAAAAVAVVFRVHYAVPAGARLHVTGDAAALGAWQPSAAVAMAREEGDTWAAAVALPAGCQLEYKYVVLDAAGAPARWQEGPNMALDLAAGPPSGRVELTDSWCQRTQLRRHYAAPPPPLPLPAAAPQAPQRAALFEVVGGGGGVHAAPAGVTGNVVPFRLAGLPQQQRAPPPPDAPHHHQQQQQQQQQLQLERAPPPPSAGGSPGRRSPGSPMSGADAAAALPELRQELEAALAALHAGAAGSGSSGSDGAADALGAAVAGLRELQEIVLSARADPRGGESCAVGGGPYGGGGAPAAAGGGVAALRGAFSPAASSLDDEDGGDDHAAPDAAHALPLAASPFSASADGALALEFGGGALDPLVAALLSDDCETCCAWVHDAICGAGGGGGAWPGDELCAVAAEAVCATAGACGGAAPAAATAPTDAFARWEALSGPAPDPASPELLRADRALAAASAAARAPLRAGAAAGLAP